MVLIHQRHVVSRKLQLLRRVHRKQKLRASSCCTVATSQSVRDSDPGTNDGQAQSSGSSVLDIASAAASKAAKSSGFDDLALRHLALEAVRTGNYWAEPEQQPEVVSYITEVFTELFSDQKFLKKNSSKMKVENGLTKRYTVAQILAKQHEADGFDPFADAEEACTAAAVDATRTASSAASEASSISVGATLVASKNIQIFESAKSWTKIGVLKAGQWAEVAGTPVDFQGFLMVPIKPKGVVEMKYLVNANAEATSSSSSSAQKATDDDARLGELAEIEHGLLAVIAAGEPDGDPVGVDEVLEVLEGCAKLGELGASVYCAERLESMHTSGDKIELPDEVLDRAFTALKPLLRPNSSSAESSLQGPWSKPPPGRSGTPNHRKSMGQLINRLGIARRERDLARGGEQVQQQRAESAAQEQALTAFAQAVAGLLAKDAKAATIKRRGLLGEAVGRICEENSLKVSTTLAFVAVVELEKLGVVTCHGRDLSLDNVAARAACQQGQKPFSAFESQLQALESVARERLSRRSKRQRAREQGKQVKRRRLEEDDA